MFAKRTPRLAAAFLAASVMVGGLAVVSSTNAQAAVLGTLTLDPPSATTAGNVKYPTFTTSAGCPTTADAYEVWLSGPGLFAAPVTPVKVITNIDNGYSEVAGFTTVNAMQSVLDAQHDLGGASSVNPAGEYTFTLRCIDSFDNSVSLGEFVGKAYYTSPTAYRATPPPPVQTKLATASGTYKVGATLRCSAAFSGATGALAYSWFNNGTKVNGATKTTFALTAAHLNRSIACGVTATNANGSTLSKSAAHKIALGNKAALKKAPKISGTAKVKKKLSVSTGTWSLPGLSYTYQWKANGKAISGAKSAKYKVAKKYKGKKLTVTVTAKKAGYAPATATTAATKKVKK